MQFIDTVLSYCGWTGVALAAVLLLMLGIQLYYYLVAYGRIPNELIPFDYETYRQYQGEAEAVLLQGELTDAYVGRSTTFLKLEEVEGAVERYPAFRVVSAEKHFPRTVSLTVEERKECYAFRRENGLYAILDEEGVYLYDREQNVNRRGGENILLNGFALLAGEAGTKVSGEYAQELVSMLSVFTEALGDARANVVSVTLSTEYELGAYFLLAMREGVTVQIFTPENHTEEKAEAVIEKYLSLSETEKTYGFFDVIDRIDGGFTVSNHRASL